MRARPGTAAVAAAVLAVAFLTLTVAVGAHGPLPGEAVASDRLRAAGMGHEGALRQTARLTDLPGLVVLAAVTLVTLLARRRFAAAGLFAVTVAVVWLGNPALKQLVRRERPPDRPADLDLSTFGFPSGHAANSAVLLGAALLVVRPGRPRRGLALVGAALVSAVGASQLLLGVHHPTDVVGGWLWVAAWVCLVAALVHRGGRSRARPSS